MTRWISFLCAIISSLYFVPSGFALIGPPEFLDPGFESHSVENGAYLPHSTANDAPWSFYQNSFIVDPFFSQTYSGSSNTRAATYAPQAGEQYVSTYAGNGGVRQLLTISVPGIYRVATYAASPSGSLFIQTPVTSGTFPMVSGEFRFLFGETQFGETHTTAAGITWQRFNSLVTVNTPGTYFFGAKNTKSGVYFNYYDNFNIELVSAIPEPSSAALGIFWIAALGLRYRRNKVQPTGSN